MKNNPILLSLIIVSVITSAICWQACKKSGKNPLIPGCGVMVGFEPTTIMLVFNNVNNPADVDTAVSTYYSPNANTHNYDLSKAHMTLSANASYHVQVLFFNMNYPVTSSSFNATPLVQEEGNVHLICFSDSVDLYGHLGADIYWTWKDLDNNKTPLPIGLVDSFHTGADSACGIWNTTLHHQYLIKNGDCAPGYIDLQVSDTVFVSPSKG